MGKAIARPRPLRLIASLALVGTALIVVPSAGASAQGRDARSTSGGVGRGRHSGVQRKYSGPLSASTDWPAFLFDAAHSGVASGAFVITKSNAALLTNAWTWMPARVGTAAGLVGKTLTSSPTVVNGVIYIGANNGNFYALDESTGAVIWSDFIGYVTKSTCGARGFSATATVTPDPVTGNLTVYVNAPNGYLYALDAASGAIEWQSVVGIPSPTQNDYFAWSSPTVAGGTVFVGISSMCDNPLVRGGVLAFDQHTGAQTASYYNVPAGDVGGSVWSSVAIGPDGTVYADTGNGPHTDQSLGTSESIVALDPTTLSLESSWQITAGLDGNEDFGASPTLFSAVLPGGTTATEMVGACNKNGVFYAWNAGDVGAGPVWRLIIGPSPTQKGSVNGCTSAAAWNGQRLFVAGPKTEIGGTDYPGGIREVNPSTGDVIWAVGLPASVQGSPTENGNGVVSIATFGKSANADYLLSASDGAILATVSTGGSPEFPTPVFSGRLLLLATENKGLLAYVAPPPP